jgi:lipopolysaccharide export system permease protein
MRKFFAVCGVWIGSRYIYRELLFPFFFSIGAVTFVLLLNFLIKSVDRLLGKGLSFRVIFEFLYLNLAWIIAMSVPMAVLVAALMSYGRLAEDNEITAMRSSGISFLTILGPGIVFGTVVAVLMVFFHNNILPDFNHKARLLTGDIYRKRPGLNIEPGYFMEDIPDYSIYVKEKSGDHLRKITIYSKDSQTVQTTIYADSGYVVVDGNTVLFTLYNGEIHELGLENLQDYRRTDFQKHRIAIPVDNLMLERRESARRGNREMTIGMMRENVQKYTLERNKVYVKIDKLLKAELDTVGIRNLEKVKQLINLKKQQNLRSIEKVQAEAKNRRLNSLQSRLTGEFDLAFSYQRQVNIYSVEIHKKISIPFACIVFMLIGAPLGVMTRRGGIAMAAVLSILFFLIYYVFLIGGEELADMVIIPPFWAMWTPNILLLAVGIFLIYYTTWEQKIIDFARLTQLFRKIFKFRSKITK